MSFVHIITYRSANPQARISSQDYQAIEALILTTPNLLYANFHTPESAKDYYTDDGHSPMLVIESYYDDLLVLEQNLAEDGHLQKLASTKWPSLQQAQIEHQVMLSRRYPVLNGDTTYVATELSCSYLVHYPGYAEDFQQWLNYYLSHHPQIMKHFPNIRAIEIYTRVDWVDALPWTRAYYMQRNKQVFDSSNDLTAALNSSVRHDMRADYEKFPPFFGENRHFAVATYSLFPNK